MDEVDLKDALTTEQAAKELRRNIGTLRRWRVLGVGPSYVKLGKYVFYTRQQLNEYKSQNIMVLSSTAEEKSHDAYFRRRKA